MQLHGFIGMTTLEECRGRTGSHQARGQVQSQSEARELLNKVPHQVVYVLEVHTLGGNVMVNQDD